MHNWNRYRNCFKTKQQTQTNIASRRLNFCLKSWTRQPVFKERKKGTSWSQRKTWETESPNHDHSSVCPFKQKVGCLWSKSKGVRSGPCELPRSLLFILQPMWLPCDFFISEMNFKLRQSKRDLLDEMLRSNCHVPSLILTQNYFKNNDSSQHDMTECQQRSNLMEIGWKYILLSHLWPRIACKLLGTVTFLMSLKNIFCLIFISNNLIVRHPRAGLETFQQGSTQELSPPLTYSSQAAKRLPPPLLSTIQQGTIIVSQEKS